MFKKIRYASVLQIISFFSFGQQDLQTSIRADCGIYTVSKTAEGNDMIFINALEWNQMIKGTKYTSDNLRTKKSRKIFIQLSDKYLSRCSAGIGFTCGIFDRVKKVHSRSSIVNNNNRVCAASLQLKDAYTVKIIFFGTVDWASLQKNL